MSEPEYCCDYCDAELAGEGLCVDCLATWHKADDFIGPPERWECCDCCWDKVVGGFHIAYGLGLCKACHDTVTKDDDDE